MEQSAVWTVLRHMNPLMKRHILVIAEYTDLNIVGFKHLNVFEYVVFAFDKSNKCDTDNYIVRLIKCRDNMKELREHLKMTFETLSLGHVYVINERKPMYSFLKEWYVQNYLEVFQMEPQKYVWEIPHVIVFDMDETLITSEDRVRIRDEFVYESLEGLKKFGCILILWSYGSREHVSRSMDETELNGFFDIVLCGGYKSTEPSKRTIVDAKSKIVYVERPFYLDNDYSSRERIPKSPRIPLWYLRKLGVNYIKTITLVDDLIYNDHSYDYFVNLKRCKEPINDWKYWHETIMSNIINYENVYSK
ncbi:38K [Cryptophlebia peltastica nucleopolyhedrovirus]|uniref:38K n=1 Tax=Cryptophlebia peltastica nucleopolyhedrovirus TaxID=2304025 RepID=A0A346RNU5_9ABAC|nr:38K [Cryptophlebia peltastica nucleopolyhedrovirus]AXS67742.1 38K [Cryptophlebia peltastica nucleopolyhedrovirus]